MGDLCYEAGIRCFSGKADKDSTYEVQSNSKTCLGQNQSLLYLKYLDIQPILEFLSLFLSVLTVPKPNII
jgi:hypothetical protein